MVNILRRSEKDPEGEFLGLWINESTGSLWVWSGKPILIGFAKDGNVIVANTFDVQFLYTPHKNEQKYEYEFDYDKIPLMVLAEVENNGYDGSSVEVWFGSLYGSVFPKDDKFVIVGQVGNVEIGSKLKLKCLPTDGEVNIKLHIISYE